MSLSATPGVFVVGAGPVATGLAGALRQAGVPVLGLWARKPAAARAAGAVAGVAAFSSAPPDLLLEADVVIVAVRDDAIADVARMLVTTGLVSRKHIMLHCSGALAAREVFAPVLDRVGGAAAIHPLRAIPDGRSAMRELRGTVFGIEGDDAGREAATRLVTALHGRALHLEGAQMAAYHAAAAIASNYVVSLMDAAVELMATAGIDRGDATAALVPLVRGTLANVEAEGPVAALTGPIRRGDAHTVRRHLAAVDDVSAELGQLYRVLGRRTVEVARRAVAGGPGSAGPGAANAATAADKTNDLDAIAALLAPTR